MRRQPRGEMGVTRPTARGRAPIEDEHLRRLSDLAANDREQFYVTQPSYRDGHLALS